MLNATAQKLGDSTVLRCQGRIVIGDAYAILRNAVLRQTHTRTLILDLAQVDCIDAGGLGASSVGSSRLSGGHHAGVCRYGHQLDW
jgi:anti-anti-sigma regulatory factor